MYIPVMTVIPIRILATVYILSIGFNPNIDPAITLVLPVCSNTKPSVVPSTIIKARDFIMFPKPSLIAIITAQAGIRTPNPTMKLTGTGAKKACTLSLAVRNTMAAMPNKRQTKM